MYLHELIEQARAGAVLTQTPGYGQISWCREHARFEYRVSGLPAILTANVLREDWEIAEPAPGACKRCKGFGKLLGDRDPMTGGDRRCPYCGGTGKLLSSEDTRKGEASESVPGLMPGCEAWHWDGDELCWESPDTFAVMEDPELRQPGSGWTGRYGYKQFEGRVLWSAQPRLWTFFGLAEPVPVPTFIAEKWETLTPDYVEMRKDGE